MFLLILFFQFEGAWLLFFLKHQQIKNEITVRIASRERASDLWHKEELSVIKIPKQLEQNPAIDFQWTDEHEFRYLGKMYDVVKQEEQGDSTVYYCIYDHEDTLAFSSYNESQQQKFAVSGQANKKLTEQLAKFLSSVYFTNDFNYQFNKPVSSSYCSFLSCNILKIDIVPPYPPPEV